MHGLLADFAAFIQDWCPIDQEILNFSALRATIQLHYIEHRSHRCPLSSSPSLVSKPPPLRASPVLAS